ncbi:hypothetical protein IT570_01915 [Candidatus Sumerlaeota bacterium]|nr:hypothetical protein [Candidatus Sumerlaeota bacterium]
MTIDGSRSLLDCARRVRPDAIQRDDVLVMAPVPLLAMAGFLLEEEELLAAYDRVLDGEHPDNLDPRDRAQTSRLESAILEACGSARLQMRELVSIDWSDPELGPDASASLLIAFTSGHAGLLVLHVPDDVPASQVVAVSESERSLHAVVAHAAHLVLPRLATQGATLLQVTMRYFACWSREDLEGIVEALIGARPADEEVRCRDLLMARDDE